MIYNPAQFDSVAVGIVVRRVPSISRWAKHVWTVVGVLPGAAPANWKELRRDGDAVEFHATTLPLELHGAETEAYLHGLATEVPSVFVVAREGEGNEPLDVLLVTASPYEAQDYTDSGEEIVEKLPMSAALMAWIEEFVSAHHQHEAFVKRKRDKTRIDQTQDGIGDPRVASAADIYASPARQRRRLN